MNDYKAQFFPSPSDLQYHRLALTEKQLTEFWYSRTLVQLQKILCINDQYLIYNIIFEQYLKHYLSHKKISPGEFFHLMYKQQTLTWVYDAKIFRNPLYQKYDNDLISTFLIAFKQRQQLPEDDVFEFLDYTVLQAGKWILKVKQSAILRIFPFLIHRFLQKREQCYYDSLQKNPIGGYFLSKHPNTPRQVVILQPNVYYYYMYSLLPRYTANIQLTVKNVFDIIAELMLNNLLIAWYNNLPQGERYQRHFKRYFRLIQKPKNKQQFTSIDNRFTEIKWQTFKTFVFKLKYKVKQTPSHYQCYQVDLKSEELLNQKYTDLSIDDQNILKAFQKNRISSPGYDECYTQFFDDVQV